MHWPIGTLVNVATVVVGSLAGLLLRRGLPERLKLAVFQAIGLVTLVIGMQLALHVKNLLVLVFSILLGALCGTALDLQGRLEAWSELLKRRLPGNEARFTEGLISAFLIFCVGSMTIVGCLQEGLTGDASLLYTKATLDGFMAAALASTYGVGVVCSILPLFVLQVTLTLLGGWFGSRVSPDVLDNLTAAGGVLILGIGLNLMELTKLRLVNFLPALAIVVLLTWLAGFVPGLH